MRAYFQESNIINEQISFVEENETYAQYVDLVL